VSEARENKEQRKEAAVSEAQGGTAVAVAMSGVGGAVSETRRGGRDGVSGAERCGGSVRGGVVSEARRGAVSEVGRGGDVRRGEVSEAWAGRVKADEPLAENTASKLIGVIPALGVRTWRVEIKTQYSGGSSFLKEPRMAALGVGLVVKDVT
jgi:hypothetical protein